MNQKIISKLTLPLLVVGFSISNGINAQSPSSTQPADAAPMSVRNKDSDKNQTFDGSKENSVVVKPDGTKIVTRPDGLIIYLYPDGSRYFKEPDGTIVNKNADGSMIINQPDGSVIHVDANGTMHNKSDQTK